MCGIVGYVGGRQAVPILVNGLARLEYRGYDSAGVAVVGSEGLAVRKLAGRVPALASLLTATPAPGTCGIAHTRWATHGAPTLINAHPHSDCNGTIALVHNGIIENAEGTYGIAVVSSAEPGTIVVARQGSPVLLGVGENGMFVASDASAILEHTRSVVYLDDGDVAVLKADGYHVRDAD